jgi:hypothetical protein
LALVGWIHGSCHARITGRVGPRISHALHTLSLWNPQQAGIAMNMAGNGMPGWPAGPGGPMQPGQPQPPEASTTTHLLRGCQTGPVEVVRVASGHPVRQATQARRYLDWRFSFYQLLHYHLRRDFFFSSLSPHAFISEIIEGLAQININRTYFTMRCSEEGSGTLEQENISDLGGGWSY